MRQSGQTLRTFSCFVQISFNFHFHALRRHRARIPCIFITANRIPHTHASKSMGAAWKNGGGSKAAPPPPLQFTPTRLADRGPRCAATTMGRNPSEVAAHRMELIRGLDPVRSAPGLGGR